MFHFLNKCNNVKCNEPSLIVPKDGHHYNVLIFKTGEWNKGYKQNTLQCILLSMYFFLKNQMIELNKYCSQLDQLKVEAHEKHSELVKGKDITFHLVNMILHDSIVIRPKLISQEVFTHLLYSPNSRHFYSSVYRIFLNFLKFPGRLSSSLLTKIKCSERMELWNWLKDCKR